MTRQLGLWRGAVVCPVPRPDPLCVAPAGPGLPPPLLPSGLFSADAASASLEAAAEYEATHMAVRHACTAR